MTTFSVSNIFRRAYYQKMRLSKGVIFDMVIDGICVMTVEKVSYFAIFEK